MKERKPKHAPITRKIKRFLTGKKVRQAHKLYPEEYFEQYWVSHHTSDGVRAMAEWTGKNKKATLAYLVEEGIKSIQRQLVQKDLDAMNTPEGSEMMNERIRRNLALRRLCRKMGWDVKKLF